MVKYYLKEGDQAVADGAQIFYEGSGRWSISETMGEVYYNGLPVEFDEKNRPYIYGNQAITEISGFVKGGRSMKKHKKYKLHPIRAQILEISEDVSANPGSAILTVVLFAGVGVGTYFVVKKLLKKPKLPEAIQPTAETAPVVAPGMPIPLAGDHSLIKGKSYSLQGTGVNVRGGPGVNYPSSASVSQGVYILKEVKKDSAGNFWGLACVRKFVSQGVYQPGNEIGWIASPYLKYYNV